MRDKCASVKNGKEFWQNMKPLISNNIREENNDIVLLNDNVIVNDQRDVCNLLNDYFVNVTKDIGECDRIQETDKFTDIINTHAMHDSVQYIKTNLKSKTNFSFHLATEDVILKKLLNLNVKKSTGWDNMPPKLLKQGANILCKPITMLVNKCIRLAKFPSDLKKGEIIPLFKSDDMLEKKNYRPVSILPCISKIFESVLIDQLNVFFIDLFSVNLSGYRKQYSCQHVLMNFIENCKKHLDNNMVYGLITSDLSKAFDCLPHRLLISKLHAYGISDNACKLIKSYFELRQQRVKLGHVRSEWVSLMKGAAQGSLFGPFLFNVFQNDLIFKLENVCDVYNYADDTSAGCSGKSVNEVYQNLQNVMSILLQWFKLNYLKANPTKFQLIVFNENVTKCIDLADNVKLLGVEIDHCLTFHDHISSLCARAGRQLGALARMSKVLPPETKLLVFQTFILCHFNYCSTIWHFCKMSDLKNMEKIQHRALKYVYNDFTSSYKELREKHNITLLFVNRVKELLIEVYKACYNISPYYLQSLFSVKESKHSLRSKMNLNVPAVNTTKYGLKSISYSCAKMWNSLSNNMKCAESLKEFKSLLSKWKMKQCTCSFCSYCILNNL